MDVAEDQALAVQDEVGAVEAAVVPHALAAASGPVLERDLRLRAVRLVRGLERARRLAHLLDDDAPRRRFLRDLRALHRPAARDAFPAKRVLLPRLHVGKVHQPLRLGIDAEVPVHDLRLVSADPHRLHRGAAGAAYAGEAGVQLPRLAVVVDGVGREHLEHGRLHGVLHVDGGGEHVLLRGVVRAVRVAAAQAVGVRVVLLAADAEAVDAVRLLHVVHRPGVEEP